MNNMNISSKNSVSKTTERGQKSEITSNRKECTSCAQNIVDSKNDISNLNSIHLVVAVIQPLQVVLLILYLVL